MPDIPGIREYISELDQKYRRRYPRPVEHSYRPDLIRLLSTLFPDYHFTNEGGHDDDTNAPDIIVSRSDLPIGYIETKPLNENLNRVERTEQLDRYRNSLPNLILTNYLEFRWYRDSEHLHTTTLGEVTGGRVRSAQRDTAEFTELLNQFITQEPTFIENAQSLAERMAASARLIASSVSSALQSSQTDAVDYQYEGFKQVFDPQITIARFADTYAQTLVYGLFAARFYHDVNQPFTRASAILEIPRANRFLSNFFSQIAGPDLDNRIAWSVNNLAELLNRVSIDRIRAEFARIAGDRDPVLHFYETFLRKYNPSTKEKMGVFYTPEPVVTFMVESTNEILIDHFGIQRGLSDHHIDSDNSCHSVTILDPAVGTGTFLYYIIRHIHSKIFGRGRSGSWAGSGGYVRKHLLPRIFGFESLMAPYTIAHMKLGIQLSETGFSFANDERLGIYLTNTLENQFASDESVPFANWLVEEAETATNVKNRTPIMVVIGNPPYSGESQNLSPTARTWVNRYRYVEGQQISERSALQFERNIQNDYVKFLGFAEYQIRSNKRGIVSYITSSAYLSSPTLVGLRYSLLETFDHIHILDLHGYARSRHGAHQGDENVFDIRDSVAICLLVKTTENTAHATVHYRSLAGRPRSSAEVLADGPAGKYEWLVENTYRSTNWRSFQPSTPDFSFIPFHPDVRDEYFRGLPLTEIFGESRTGIVTAKDRFAIADDRETLRARLEGFMNYPGNWEAASQAYGIRVRGDWHRDRAIRVQEQLSDLNDLDDVIEPLCYRPFLNQYICYLPLLLDTPAQDVMRHMLRGDNIALISGRSNHTGVPDHFFCTRLLAEAKSGESTRQARVFPLYRYENLNGDTMFDNGDFERVSNISSSVISRFRNNLKHKEGYTDPSKVSERDVFRYIYAILHSGDFRSRYRQFLAEDYPRIPLTENVRLFWRLTVLGRILEELHTQPSERAREVGAFEREGTNVVDHVRWRPDAADSRLGSIWINQTQCFDKIPALAWELHIGGYRVLEKWLKHYRGKTLDFDHVEHFLRLVGASMKTVRATETIDRAVRFEGSFPI